MKLKIRVGKKKKRSPRRPVLVPHPKSGLYPTARALPNTEEHVGRRALPYPLPDPTLGIARRSRLPRFLGDSGHIGAVRPRVTTGALGKLLRTLARIERKRRVIHAPVDCPYLLVCVYPPTLTVEPIGFVEAETL